MIAVGLSLYLGNQYPDVPGPLNTYFTIGYAIGLSFAAMYMAVNLATIGYFWREQRAEFNWFKHLIVPVIGFIADDPGLLRCPRRGHPADPRTSSWRRSASRTRSCRRWSACGCSSASSSGCTSGSRERDKLSSVREAMGEERGRSERRDRRPSASTWDAGTGLTGPASDDRRVERDHHRDHPRRARRDPPRLGPGDPAGRDGLVGGRRRVRLPRRIERAADRRVDDGRPRDARLRPGRPGQRPGRGRRRRARRFAPDRHPRAGAGRLGLDRQHPRLRSAGRRLPRPVLQGHGGARGQRAGRVLARDPRARWRRSAARWASPRSPGR